MRVAANFSGTKSSPKKWNSKRLQNPGADGHSPRALDGGGLLRAVRPAAEARRAADRRRPAGRSCSSAQAWLVGLEPLALAAAMRAFYQQLFRSGPLSPEKLLCTWRLAKPELSRHEGGQDSEYAHRALTLLGRYFTSSAARFDGAGCPLRGGGSAGRAKSSEKLEEIAPERVGRLLLVLLVAVQLTPTRSTTSLFTVYLLTTRTIPRHPSNTSTICYDGAVK